MLGALDQAEHVAHAEDAGDDAVGIERLKRVVFLAQPHELHGRPSDFADGERRPAARVAVELGEHNSGEAEPAVEFAGGAHRVLADHGVGDEQDFGGLQLLF